MKRMTARAAAATALLAFASTAWAQTFTVYSVTGEAQMLKNRTMVALTPRQSIEATTLLNIGSESAVTVLDESNSRLYYFTSQGKHTTAELVSMTENNAKNVSRQYMSYMVKQLFSDDSQRMSHPDTYMQATAMSYRATALDSMLMCSLSQALSEVEGRRSEVEGRGLDVDFELMTCGTGLPVTDHVARNTGCYARVTNHTDRMLYVNLLNIDSKGSKYLVLPVDDAAACAHLILPPMSTVSFKADPFVFTEPASDETFILVATEEPVDFSVLMSPVKSFSGKGMNIGLQVSNYHVD